MEQPEGQGKRGLGGGVTDPIKLCRQNATAVRAKSDADRAAMRARFPFAAGIVSELVAAGLKPRLLTMHENGRSYYHTKRR